MSIRLALFAALVLSSVARAADEVPDLPFRMERYRADYRVDLDGSNVRSYAFAKTVLKESAVDSIRKAHITYSTSVEKADVLEAYTRKANGTRVKARKDSFQLSVDSGAKGAPPAFSDQTTLTVVFPDVAVGDTVVLRYKVTQSEAMFRGHFSVFEQFPRTFAYDDVRVTISAPATMQARFHARELTERTVEEKGRRVVEWTFQNKNPTRSRRRDFSVYDIEKDPGYIYSTFSWYAQIAAAYGERATPRAAVNDRIRALADEITAGKEDPGDRARVLYDWVAIHVSYAGNCIGVGAVVPRELGFVLDNRMGDCKDHATLLQALLAAKGIPSVQTLLNATNLYTLPSPPVVSAVNHVINYVPTLDLFLDSTSRDTPFGMLPMGDQDKTVLLVDGSKEGARTPVTPIGENRQRTKTVAKIASDGSISAEIEVQQQGIYAVNTRAWMRVLPKDKEDDLVKDVFQSAGLTASGSIRKDDPTALLDSYNFGLKLDVKNFLQRPGAGALSVAPLFGTATSVAHFAWSTVNLDNDADFDLACSSGRAEEEFEYEFPPDLKILSVPDDANLSNDFLSYEAKYKLDGNHLTVKRTFDDRTKGNDCSPAVMATYKAFVAQVIPNLKAQVLYK
jgi:transglutaminase-like putative cysteine protease